MKQESKKDSIEEKENIYSIAKQCSLFYNMTRQQIEAVIYSARSRICKYKKNDFIFHEEETPRKLYILLSGRIDIAKDMSEGKRILLTTIEQPGELFGEIYLFVQKDHYDMHAMVNEDALILELSEKLFQQEGKESMQAQYILSQNLLRIFAQKAYGLNQKCRILGSSSVGEKIIRFLLEQPQLGQEKPFTREDMADYLNVTRPSLSRELSRLQREGILEIHGRDIKIVDREMAGAYLK